MLKHTDPATLMEISGEAVSSSGIGIYRQKKRVAEGSASTTGPSPNQPMERPEQLRQKFAHSLKVRCSIGGAHAYSIYMLHRVWHDRPVFESEIY